MNVLYSTQIKDVEIKRNLYVIINPSRYCSKAAEAFTMEILPQFSSKPEILKKELFTKSCDITPNLLSITNDEE